MTLEARKITFGYQRGEPVVSDVSVAVRPGRVAVVVGPNGAGKTTLLRLLLGALRPWSGRVLLDGAPLGDVPRRDRALRIAYIPQRTSLAAAFTVEEVVRLGRFGAGRNDGAVRRALADAGLEDSRDRLFGALSVGQQQRATVAMALAQLDRARPEEPLPRREGALLADEPVSAMDPLHAAQTLALLRGLAQGGAAVCIVLHDFTAAARCAHDALLLDACGRVVAAGPADESLNPRVLSSIFGLPFERVVTGSGPVLVCGHAPGTPGTPGTSGTPGAAGAGELSEAPDDPVPDEAERPPHA